MLELKPGGVELVEQGFTSTAQAINDFTGLYFSYEKEELHWREWILASGKTLIFATYTTEPEQAGMDDVVIDQILETLVLN